MQVLARGKLGVEPSKELQKPLMTVGGYYGPITRPSTTSGAGTRRRRIFFCVRGSVDFARFLAPRFLRPAWNFFDSRNNTE